MSEGRHWYLPYAMRSVNGKPYRRYVILAQAGIQTFHCVLRWGYAWIPACALIFTHIFRTMLDFKGFLVCLR